MSSSVREPIKEIVRDPVVIGVFVFMAALVGYNSAYGDQATFHFITGGIAANITVLVIKTQGSDDSLRDLFSSDSDGLAVSINETTPEWIEQKHVFTMVKTARQKDRFCQLAHGIPEPIYRRWSQLSVGLVGLFLFGWIAAIIIATPLAIVEVGSYILSLEWLELLGAPESSPEVNPIDAMIELVTLYAGYLVLFSIFLPGVILHEFGHLTAFVRNDIGVENYGLVFVGPIPVGAFVSSDDDIEEDDVPPSVLREIVSAGIIYNVAWGAFILTATAVFIVLSSANLTSIYGVFTPGVPEFGIADAVATMAIFFGIGEIFMGVFNAIPITKLDGGHYFKSLRREVGSGE